MNAWMDDAILKNALLCDALIGDQLIRANLENADLTGSRLYGADFTYANLKGIKLLCKEIEKTKFNGAIYNGDTIFPDNFIPEQHGMKKASK
ncbi:pentapeptide repeat-containing protein [Haloplasma contractile SSD-17B]|uniref:Pentapeptide repeat-containing protein n=2 Tax=Haloplasma TaxID=471824 RepID=U2EE75_9MOLU|nr:pentapeptide repeat-containing protein [Haloplasma contractile SSD-17B]